MACDLRYLPAGFDWQRVIDAYEARGEALDGGARAVHQPKPIRFTSVRGRDYTLAEVRPIVLKRIRARWGAELLARFPGWRDRVLAALADDSPFARSNNGCIPGALVRDLDPIVFASEPAAARSA